MPAISIIIPVYNTSAYLRECVDSCIAGAAESIGSSTNGHSAASKVEIILVDDGSTDDSAAIAEEYAARFGFVKVISKSNGGASDARNAGIAAAAGEYLLFVDSDDYVLGGSIDKIISSISATCAATGNRDATGGCDVIFLRADMLFENGKIKDWTYNYDKNFVCGINPGEVLSYIARISRFPVSPCVKMLRRDFVNKNNLLFTVGIVCEDVDFMLSVMLAARSFGCLDFPYYYARKRGGSVMTSPEGAEHRFSSTLFIIKKWLGFKNGTETETIFVKSALAVQVLYLMAMFYRLRGRNEYIKEVKNLAFLLKYGGSRIFFPVRVIYNTFGLRITSAILSKLLLRD